jgi:TonB family protein
LSEEKKHKIFTAADIEKYHKGLLSPGEMNELEKAALDDPFLADALEGYGVANINAAADLSELKYKLENRVEKGKVISLAPRGYGFKWWRIAAAIVLIGGLGVLTFKLSSNKNKNSLAKLDEKKSSQPSVPIVADSNESAAHDSTRVASTNKHTDTKATGRLKISTVKPSAQNDSTSVAATDVTVGVQSSKYAEQKKGLVDDKKNEELSATPFAKTKKPEANNIQQHVVLNEKQNAANESQSLNYFRGRIVDDKNQPLPFANITNTRDNVGTYADAQGNFTLVSFDTVLNVQVKSIGFENNLAQLKNNVTSNKIVLKDDKAASDKIISSRQSVGNPSPMANMKVEEPQPADGWINYNTYIANNLNVPEEIRMKHEKGQVQVSFDVNQIGEPVDIKVEKSLCQRCDEEAVRLIKQGPKWKNKSKKARRVTISVPFDVDR